MKRRFETLFAVLSVIFFAACGVPVKHYASLVHGEFESLSARTESNGAAVDIAYVPGATKDQRLDIIRAHAPGPAPVIVFIHGGTWKMGTRKWFAYIGETFAREGFVTVLVDYRLYPEVKYPVFVDDCVASLNWVMAHIAEYGGDPERVVISGHSAGAHIAAIMLLNDRFRREMTFDVMKLRGAVMLSGGYDFRNSLSIPEDFIREVMGTEENYLDSQPIRHVRADVPPMLILNGDHDTITREIKAYQFALRMMNAGADVQYEKISGGDHLSVIIDLQPGRRGPAFQDFLKFAREKTDARVDQAPEKAPVKPEKSSGRDREFINFFS